MTRGSKWLDMKALHMRFDDDIRPVYLGMDFDGDDGL